MQGAEPLACRTFTRRQFLPLLMGLLAGFLGFPSAFLTFVLLPISSLSPKFHTLLLFLVHLLPWRAQDVTDPALTVRSPFPHLPQSRASAAYSMRTLELLPSIVTPPLFSVTPLPSHSSSKPRSLFTRLLHPHPTSYSIQPSPLLNSPSCHTTAGQV